MKNKKLNDAYKILRRKMEEVLERYAKGGYAKITSRVIDEGKQRAAFVISREMEGYRSCALWYAEVNKPPKMIYSQHAYGISDPNPYIRVLKIENDGVVVERSSRYSKYETEKVKITFNEEVIYEEFSEKAKALVGKVGDKLGHDYISEQKIVEKQKHKVGAFIWAAENGVNCGFDTLYVVYEKENKELEIKEIDSYRWYMSIEDLKVENNNAIIKYKKGENIIEQKIPLE